MDGQEECEKCGNAPYTLHAHHIIPRRQFEYSAHADALQNLVALCQWCHQECEELSARKQLQHYTQNTRRTFKNWAARHFDKPADPKDREFVSPHTGLYEVVRDPRADTQQGADTNEQEEP
jgi:hypothetical protein